MYKALLRCSSMFKSAGVSRKLVQRIFQAKLIAPNFQSLCKRSVIMSSKSLDPKRKKKEELVELYHSQDVVPSKSMLSTEMELELTPLLTSKIPFNAEFVFPDNQPISLLECEASFARLTEQEKLYAHHLSRAAWYGGLIVLMQTSPESPAIYKILRAAIRSQSLEQLKTKVMAKDDRFTARDFDAFLVYTAAFLCNMGNYRGFGDSKFVPNMKVNKFLEVLQASENWEEIKGYFYEGLLTTIFDTSDKFQQLGYPQNGNGITGYFSWNCTEKDLDLASRYLKQKNLLAYNQRLFKTVNPITGKSHFEIRIASVNSTHSEDGTEESFEDAVFHTTRGDYSEVLKKVCEELEHAQNYGNGLEREMIRQYIKSFKTGCIKSHVEGSRIWVENKQPITETYIGFIETYRDPSGQRGEFEGFCAVVDKENSAKFQKLVEKAEVFIKQLPWPKEFERDVYLRPDFTSLDVLSFSGSGVPAGINIPNYDEICQSIGFKNVSLKNVVLTTLTDQSIPFLKPEDQELMKQYRIKSFEVQVGIHELLGHGSGKLLRATDNGGFNFDPDLIDPITKKKVASWYKVGETYDSIFTDASSTLEELRAECVGLYLSLNKPVLSIFGYEDSEAENITYVNWLSMIYNGLLKALEMYRPSSKKWGQAHSQARFVIGKVLLEAGEDLLNVKYANDGTDILLTLDKTKIQTVGKAALGSFLEKLNIYKATANASAARALLNHYSEICEVDPAGSQDCDWLGFRKIVIEKRIPRKLLVQPNTELKHGKVVFHSYPATPEGVIQSWMDRFPTKELDEAITNRSDPDRKHFKFTQSASE